MYVHVTRSDGCYSPPPSSDHPRCVPHVQEEDNREGEWQLLLPMLHLPLREMVWLDRLPHPNLQFCSNWHSTQQNRPRDSSVSVGRNSWVHALCIYTSRGYYSMVAFISLGALIVQLLFNSSSNWRNTVKIMYSAPSNTRLAHSHTPGYQNVSFSLQGVCTEVCCLSDACCSSTCEL